MRAGGRTPARRPACLVARRAAQLRGFTGAPYIEYLRGRRALSAALAAITAAVVEPMLSSIRLAALAIAVLSFVMLFGLRWGMLRTMGMAAGLGAAWTLPGS